MIEYIPQALSSLGAATNLVSTLMGLRDFSKYASTFTELQGHIIKANSFIISEQQSHSLLMTKIDELEKEVVRLKNWDAEREKYTRREIAPGNFAYIVTDYVGPLENAHKYCCNCFDDYKKSTLNQSHEGRNNILSCHKKCPDLKFQYYKDELA